MNMGVFHNSRLQNGEKFTRSLPLMRLNRVNLSYEVVSGHFLKSGPVSLYIWVFPLPFCFKTASKFQNAFKNEIRVQFFPRHQKLKNCKRLQKGFKGTSKGSKSSQVLLNEEISPRSLHLAGPSLIWSCLESFWSLFEVRLVLRGGPL